MASNQSIKPQKLTESGLARKLGVSRQAIHDLVKRQVLSKDADGLIDVEMAKLALLNRVRPSGKTTATLQDQPATAAPPKAPGDDDTDDNPEITSYHVAKTLREAAEAQIARLKLGEMQGRFIEKTHVDRAVFEAARGLRDGMTNCSRRMAAEVATLATPTECETVIARELRHLLESFTRQLALKIAPPPATEAATASPSES